jgi:hypothetical protein
MVGIGKSSGVGLTGVQAPAKSSDVVGDRTFTHPTLPADCLRFVITTEGDRHDLHAAVERYATQLWVGEYKRPWSRLGMFGK